MTKEETKARLKTDVPFFVSFLMENNPEKIKALLLRERIITALDDKSVIMSKFLTTVLQDQNHKLLNMVKNEVGYNNLANNWTGNLN